MGADAPGRPRVAALLARARLHRGRRRGRRRRDRCRRSSGPAGPALASVALVKVLAAMSGGVDSAVAAARAVDAGHDVTGVHLALSAAPATLRTARAAAARSRTPTTPAAPPTCSASRSTSGISPSGSAPTSSTTSSASTPPGARPTRACAATRRSSSRRCSTARWRSASTPSSPATTPGSSTAGCCRSVDAGQGPVLRARRVHAAPARPRDVPARRLHQGRGAGRGRRARAGGRRQARLARHLLHRRRRHPRVPVRAASARSDGPIVDAASGDVLGTHAGLVRLHRRPAARAATCSDRRPAATRATSCRSGRPTTPSWSGRGALLDADVVAGRAVGVDVGAAPGREPSSARCSCARTA